MAKEGTGDPTGTRAADSPSACPTRNTAVASKRKKKPLNAGASSLTSSVFFRHRMTFGGTTTTRVGTPLTMIVVITRAFERARVADFLAFAAK